MHVTALLGLFTCVLARTRAAPDAAAVPLRLSQPLPSMEQAAANGLPKVVTAYHIPVGVPEAARIAAVEAEAAAQPDAEKKPDVMIVGGLASYRGEHPFMAGLVITLTSGETSICGGSLVSGTAVLTSAACYWDGYSQAYSMEVVLGSVTLFSGGTRVYARTIIIHPVYTPASVHNNLGILVVPYQPPTAYVKPIAMASGSDQFVGSRAEAIGYGRTADGAPITTAASLRDVFVNVISNSACQQYYSTNLVTVAEVCSSGVGGRNPCGGDQGGPLILNSGGGNDLLVGVFAFGSSAGCQAGAPAAYMRVSYYYNWIRANS